MAEMITPVTAHPAFLKAAHYFNVKPVFVPVDKDFKVNINAVDKACNKNIHKCGIKLRVTPLSGL